MSAESKQENPLLVQGKTGLWEVVIGMEVHAQIVSRSKLFSGASTAHNVDENQQVSLVDAALPGMLPVLNEYCVEQAVKTGLALNAKINLYSAFDRKNYFYADLPQGYQISQFTHPVVGEGEIILDMDDGSEVPVGIERIHLEQDAGKSFHDQHPNSSFIDLNRAGVGLMEIVSRPDMRCAAQAAAFLKKLRLILIYVGSCNGNMESGNMRADINISVRRPGEPLGTRCEVKNVNSVRFLQMAVQYEVQRQIAMIERGEAVVQETRLFDARLGQTRSMRSKEDAHDYRYFPDPDLLPLEISQEWVDALKQRLPELPDDRKKRFTTQYQISAYDAQVLISDPHVSAYFEAALEHVGSPVLLAKWVTGELFAYLNKHHLQIEDSRIDPPILGQLVSLIEDGRISGKIAKEVFDIIWSEGGNPLDIVKQRNMLQMSDAGELEAIVDDVIAASPDNVAAFQAGKDKLIGWFVGQVMKKTSGRANPEQVNALLRKKLQSSS